VKFLKNTAIILLITGGLLALLEIMTRIFWNQESRLVTLSKQDHAIKLDSQTYTFRFEPNTKYRHDCSEFSITYEINSEGMRDPNTYLGKPRDTTKIRILAVGDSFTYGEGSEQEDTWLSRLERDVKAKGKTIEIVKAGVSAYDQYQEYMYLKEIIGLYKPDYVLLGFLANDVMGNKPLAERSMPGNLQKQDEGGHEKSRSGSFNLIKNFQTLALAKKIVLSNDALYRSMYESTGRADYFKKADKRSPEVLSQFNITAELFRQIDSLCEANGAPLIIASIPQFYEVLGENKNDIDIEIMDHEFMPLALKWGFRWIPTLSEFQKGYVSGTKTHYRVDGHLTPQGNEILAGVVKPQLEKILNEN
jgi:hypothetical protein